MSTQTKIKGIIVNDDLPILTSDGLVSKAYIDYVEALAGKGYTMNATQKSAVSAFLASLSEYGLTEYILTMFPFICSATKRSALSVPLIGSVNYGNVSDAWPGAVVSDGEVIGVNQDVTSSLVTLGSVLPSVDFLGAAVSFKKDATNEAGEYLDRILNFGSKLNIRLQRTVTGDYVRFYYPQDATSNYTTIPAPSGGISDAGNGFALAMFRNPLGYVRYFKFNNGVVSDGSEIGDFRPPRYVAADMSATISSAGNSEHATWTSITTFKKLMSAEQAERYMQILETFMTALGRAA